jgi:hypothetical protein
MERVQPDLQVTQPFSCDVVCRRWVSRKGRVGWIVWTRMHMERRRMHTQVTSVTSGRKKWRKKNAQPSPRSLPHLARNARSRLERNSMCQPYYRITEYLYVQRQTLCPTSEKLSDADTRTVEALSVSPHPPASLHMVDLQRQAWEQRCTAYRRERPARRRAATRYAPMHHPLRNKHACGSAADATRHEWKEPTNAMLHAEPGPSSASGEPVLTNCNCTSTSRSSGMDLSASLSTNL